MFPVANDIKRYYIDLLRLTIQPTHFQVLQKEWGIMQREQPQPLTAQG